MTRRFRFIIPRHRSEPSSFQVILSILVIIPSHRLRENGGVGGTYRTLRYVIGIGYVTEIGRAAGAGQIGLATRSRCRAPARLGLSGEHKFDPGDSE